MAIQLVLPYQALGDQVSVTAVPEAFFAQTGKKLFFSDKRIWVFKHNPFISLRAARRGDTEFKLYPDACIAPLVDRYTQRYGTHVFGSQTEYLINQIGLASARTRHPRLYVHEESDIVPHKIVVHTTGSDRTSRGQAPFCAELGEDAVRVMSDEVISAIRRNYKDWMIVQVGAASDKPIEGKNVVDLRGKLDYWKAAAEIASSARFIGVNSGPMHIANCYPRVSKRIVLMEFSSAYLQTRIDGLASPFRAGDVRNHLASWLDPANAYFNRFDHDLGSTFAFTKI
jgi:hypothetical protein